MRSEGYFIFVCILFNLLDLQSQCAGVVWCDVDRVYTIRTQHFPPVPPLPGIVGADRFRLN